MLKSKKTIELKDFVEGLFGIYYMSYKDVPTNIAQAVSQIIEDMMETEVNTYYGPGSRIGTGSMKSDNDNLLIYTTNSGRFLIYNTYDKHIYLANMDESKCFIEELKVYFKTDFEKIDDIGFTYRLLNRVNQDGEFIDYDGCIYYESGEKVENNYLEIRKNISKIISKKLTCPDCPLPSYLEEGGEDEE